MILADFTWFPNEQFNIQRQYMWGWTVGWQDGTTLDSFGRTTVLTEHVFGGYKLVVTFKDWWWTWDNRSAKVSDILEDFYAVDPITHLPVSAGSVSAGFQFEPLYDVNLFKIIVPAPVNFYWFFRFPEASRPYWSPMIDTAPATPFHFP